MDNYQIKEETDEEDPFEINFPIPVYGEQEYLKEADGDEEFWM